MSTGLLSSALARLCKRRRGEKIINVSNVAQKDMSNNSVHSEIATNLDGALDSSRHLVVGHGQSLSVRHGVGAVHSVTLRRRQAA